MAQTAVDIVVKTAGLGRLVQLDKSLKGTAANAVKAGAGVDQLTGKLTKSGRQIRQAANGLEYFIDKAGRARKVNGQFVTTAEAAAAGIKRLGNNAERAGRQAGDAQTGFSGLTGAVKNLLSAYALISATKFVIGKTAELETQTRSLKVLTGELETAERIISRLQKFSAVTPFTSTELIETSKRLAAFGVDTEKLVDTTKRLADVSGATGARLTEVATAYGQIQAKGRLQGEELLQLQERGIGLQEELQKMYGLTGEEFSKALQKGQFSAEAVEVAIRRLTEAGGKYADGAISQSDTLAGKFSTLIDGIENIARALGNVLAPALKNILGLAINVTNQIIDAINRAQLAGKLGLDQRAQKGILDQARKEAEEIVNLRNIADPFERNKVFQQVAAQRETDLLKQLGFESGKLQLEIEPVFADNEIPELLKQNTKTKTGGSSRGSRAGRESKVPALERELALAKELEPLYGRIAEAKLRGDEETVIRLQGEQALLELKKKEADILASNSPAAEKLLELEKLGYEVRKQVLDTTYELKELEQSRKEALEGITQPLEDELQLLEAKLNGNEEEIKQLQEIRDLKQQILEIDPNADTSQVEAMVQQRDALREQVAEMEKTKELVNQISGTIASEFTSAISSVIQGTKSVDEAFSDMLGNIGKAFVDMALEIIQQQMVLIANALIMKALGISMPGAGSGAFGSGASAPISNIPFSAGGIGYRADGGPVIGGKPYIVGEEGQELFIPGFSGTIVPNDVFEATKEALIEDGEVIATDDSEAEAEKALTANNSSISTTNNNTTETTDAEAEKALTANNSSISTTYNNTTADSTDAETAKALERNSEIINSTLRNSEVQSALTENNKSIKNINYGDSTSVSEAFAVNNNSIQSQKMAAATTTERETMQQLMNSSSKMTVSYESTVINQQEYVTAEQHQKGVTQAAMKGRDMALASLKNSVRARKGIGLS